MFSLFFIVPNTYVCPMFLNIINGIILYIFHYLAFLTLCLWDSLKLVRVTLIHSFICTVALGLTMKYLYIPLFMCTGLFLSFTIMNSDGSGSTKRSMELKLTASVGLWAITDMMLKRTASKQNGKKPPFHSLPPVFPSVPICKTQQETTWKYDVSSLIHVSSLSQPPNHRGDFRMANL